MDSRASPDLVFDKGLCDIFSIRNAATVSNDDILGNMELSTKIIGTKIILVLGHVKCGAIFRFLRYFKIGNLTKLLNMIKLAIEAKKVLVTNRTGSNEAFVNSLTTNNTQLVMEQIWQGSSIIEQLETEGNVQIDGELIRCNKRRKDFLLIANTN